MTTTTGDLERTGTTALPGSWRRPVHATGLVLVYQALATPVLLATGLVVLSLLAVVLGVGLLLLPLTVPLLAETARAHRWLAEVWLGRSLPPPYAVTRGGLPLRVWLRDPARWRDLAWGFANCTLGVLLTTLALLPLASAVWWSFFPLVYGLSPAGVFDGTLLLVQVHSFPASFLAWAYAAVSVGLWWTLTPALLTAKVRLDAALLEPPRAVRLEQRVRDLTESRTDTVDASAAELRRIERDLHDGAQARLVSVQMTLGLAESVLDRDPEQARALLAEARRTGSAALGDLRAVVRGMHPPVLADRGLAGAVQALVLDLAVPVTLTVDLPGRPAAPVESAVYFAVAELLTNVGKHARATRAWVSMAYDGRLVVEVGDNGVGGARPDAGTGILGVRRRLAAFDGTLSMGSPEGGPTLVRLEVPAELT